MTLGNFVLQIIYWSFLELVHSLSWGDPIFSLTVVYYSSFFLAAPTVFEVLIDLLRKKFAFGCRYFD